MEKHKVWRAVSKYEVPKNAKVVTSTWAMKKKSNGTYRARLNARGFNKCDQDHYNGSTIAAPVTNEEMVRIVTALMVMARWAGQVLDVKGTLLHGEFEEGEGVYMGVPQGFEDIYPPNVVLLLLQTIYGIKQASVTYWKRAKQALCAMKCKRNAADPCLHFK